MAGHLQALLEGIVAEPDRHLWELPLLSAAERQQVLVEWNATRVDYRTRAVHPRAVRGPGGADARGGSGSVGRRAVELSRVERGEPINWRIICAGWG